jgi:hypothetical protein
LKAAVLFSLLLAFAACKRAPVAPGSTPKPFQPAIRFLSHDGDPAKPADMTFQVKSATGSEFLKLGDRISNTTIKLTGFDSAEEQLIVTDTATNQSARLTRPKPVNSPPTF